MAAHPDQRQMQLTSLNTDCLICLAAYLEGADFCRLLCASRVIAEATAEARADLAAAGDTKKLYSLHFWAISEQRSRPQKEDFHEVLPYLEVCFAAPGQPPQQAQPQQQNQQQPQAAAGPQQQQQHPAFASRPKLQLLTAAARIGGWLQPTAEVDGGAAQQLALQALKECFGDSVAAAVAAITSDARCPAAAKGFWGCIFLGLMTSMCSEVPDKAAARLVRSLLQAGQPGSLFPDAAAVPVICPLFMPGTAEDPGRVQCCWQLSAQANYVHYHAQQFVSAVLVLLRYMTRVVNAVGMPGDGVKDDLIKQLHYDIQMVLIQLHNEREAAAVAAVQGRPDEPVWQLNDPAVLQALGFQDGTCLTAEQYRICNYAVPENPRAEAPIVTINALAGCAKTTTLCPLILLQPKLTILYTAYNKAVVEDMKKRAARACQLLGRPCNYEGLPLNVHFMTTHGLAEESRQEYISHPGWKVEGVKGYALVPPLNMVDFFRERQQAAAAVGRHGGASYGMGWLVKDVLHEFCTSADDVIGPTHLNSQSIKAKYTPTTKKYAGLTPAEAVLVAQQMWDRIVSKRFSELTVDFNWYLKTFAMKVVESGRQLIGPTGRPYDLILVDEAQDVNDVTYQLLMSQRCMIGFVGDRWQHIYGFNNAKDALRKASREAGRPKQAYGLSHSFRLGPMVAEVANRVLHELGEHHQLMIASGRREAAVYAMLEEPQGPPAEPAAGGAAAAAAAHAAENGPAAADGELEEAEEPLGAANQQRAAAFQAWLQDNLTQPFRALHD